MGDAMDESRKPSIRSSSFSYMAEGEPMDIVVADDNIVQLAYLTKLCEQLGYRAIPAQDGRQALKLVVSTGAEILLSDYQMPEMNGIELTKAIRALTLDHYVHVILVTGSDTGGTRADAFEAGADDFITKGQETITLRARLRSASRLVMHQRELNKQNQMLKEFSDRINADLKAAANAQRQLLPDIRKEILGTKIASAFVPSSIVSGDMFGVYQLDERRLGFYAVDVSGHGIHASLLSVAIGHLITKEYFTNMVHLSENMSDPAALVRDLNHRFAASDNDDYFTMFCGVLDSQTGELDYCQAAYPSPLFLSETKGVCEIGDGGFPVGMFPSVEYETRRLHFRKGTTLVIYSDAATEAENQSGQAFGAARLSDIILAHREAAPSDMPGILVNELATWRAGRPLEDDLTVVVLKRTI